MRGHSRGALPATWRHGTFSECTACQGLSRDAEMGPHPQAPPDGQAWPRDGKGAPLVDPDRGAPRSVRLLGSTCTFHLSELFPGGESLILFPGTCFSRALVWFSSETQPSSPVREDHKHHFCLGTFVASPFLPAKGSDF